MKKYWWVNHKRTFKQEIDGGYLWSPKTEKNGVRSQFYDHMREASPGDFVLSFAGGMIRHVGQVSEYAVTGGKPAEFGAAGDNWSLDGWLLPLKWMKMRQATRPKEYISELRSLLPDKYSPINLSSGNGNQKAYLAKISVGAFDRILSGSGFDRELAFGEQEHPPILAPYAELLDEALERRLAISPELSSTEREQVINSRRGQGLFRLNVSSLEFACRLTGITNPFLLIASHIKPWRLCATSHERLDGNNGLLLTPHVDLLFDRGFISFNDNGDVQISTRLAQADISRLGIGGALTNISKGFTEQQRYYLRFHRENVFLR